MEIKHLLETRTPNPDLQQDARPSLREYRSSLETEIPNHAEIESGEPKPRPADGAAAETCLPTREALTRYRRSVHLRARARCGALEEGGCVHLWVLRRDGRG